MLLFFSCANYWNNYGRSSRVPTWGDVTVDAEEAAGTLTVVHLLAGGRGPHAQATHTRVRQTRVCEKIEHLYNLYQCQTANRYQIYELSIRLC